MKALLKEAGSRYRGKTESHTNQWKEAKIILTKGKYIIMIKHLQIFFYWVMQRKRQMIEE